MGITSTDWNEKFKEERASYNRGSIPTVSAVGEIWRTVPESNYTEQVSLCGKHRTTTKERILAGKPGLTETRAHPALVAKVFPLSEERLF